MGSGKSTIAVFLAQKLQIPFKDLDQIIENETQMTIKTIFESKGEIYFRKLEHTILKQLMTLNESFVLSLGGGTPCYANNHEFLKGEGIVSFYLKVAIETLANRLRNGLLQNLEVCTQRYFCFVTSITSTGIGYNTTVHHGIGIC